MNYETKVIELLSAIAGLAPGGGAPADPVGAAVDTPATTNTGTFSLISLCKRLLAHILQPRIPYGVLISTVGDNIILAAPGATTEYVVTGLRIQNNTAIVTTVLIKRGVSGADPLRLRTVGDGLGMSEVYGFTEALRCGANNAFVLNLSAANAHGVSVIYYLASTSTGLPT